MHAHQCVRMNMYCVLYTLGLQASVWAHTGASRYVYTVGVYHKMNNSIYNNIQNPIDEYEKRVHVGKACWLVFAEMRLKHAHTIIIILMMTAQCHITMCYSLNKCWWKLTWRSKFAKNSMKTMEAHTQVAIGEELNMCLASDIMQHFHGYQYSGRYRIRTSSVALRNTCTAYSSVHSIKSLSLTATIWSPSANLSCCQATPLWVSFLI